VRARARTHSAVDPSSSRLPWLLRHSTSDESKTQQQSNKSPAPSRHRHSASIGAPEESRLRPRRLFIARAAGNRAIAEGDLQSVRWAFRTLSAFPSVGPLSFQPILYQRLFFSFSDSDLRFTRGGWGALDAVSDSISVQWMVRSL